VFAYDVKLGSIGVKLKGLSVPPPLRQPSDSSSGETRFFSTSNASLCRKPPPFTQFRVLSQTIRRLTPKRVGVGFFLCDSGLFSPVENPCFFCSAPPRSFFLNSSSAVGAPSPQGTPLAHRSFNLSSSTFFLPTQAYRRPFFGEAFMACPTALPVAPPGCCLLFFGNSSFCIFLPPE